MRLEVASAALLQALQRGFALRRVRAAAISEVHGKLWLAALGTPSSRICIEHRRNMFPMEWTGELQRRSDHQPSVSEYRSFMLQFQKTMHLLNTKPLL